MRAATAALAIVIATSAPALAQDAGVRPPRTSVEGPAPRATDPTTMPAPRARPPRPRRVEPSPSAAEPEPTTETSISPSAEGAPDAIPVTPPGQIVQPLPPADHLDGGVPALDGGDPWQLDGSIDLDAGVPAAPADAGPPDAGPLALVEPDAGPPPVPPASPETSSDILGALSAWMWDRAEREVEREVAQQRAPEPLERAAPEPPSDIQLVLNESLREWLGFALPERRMSFFGLLVLLALAVLALWAIGRVRRPLPERGLVPRLLGAVHLAVRLATVVMALMLASRLLPSWLHPSLLLTIAAVAVALGFGAVWALLPDVVGGIVLLTEGRLKPGQWIMGEGFAGIVEQIGPRATLLRGPDGALVTVPNRAIVRTPVRASDRRWHEIEVELRAPPNARASELREAIRDAVLSSPYIPPDPSIALSRDPREPDRWRLKVRLLDVRFGAQFEGQLLERVEEALAHATPEREGEAE